MNRINLEKTDEMLLKSFVEARTPRFYKELGLACQTTEYLIGLAFRCLHRDSDLTFELLLNEEDENEIDEAVSKDYPDIPSKLYRLQMKIAYLVLQKYYNRDGSMKL